MTPARTTPSVALGVLLAAALLAGCTASAEPKTAGEQVRDAVDNFSADNTGSFTLTVGLGDVPLVDEGAYRVEPDAVALLRRLPGGGTRRILRLTGDVWVEQPRSTGAPTADGTGGRTGCWLHGDAGDAQALREAAGTDLVFSAAAVEVPLSLRAGREVDGHLVADANLRAVALALGGRALRALQLRNDRADVPVSVTVADARVTGWRVSVADVAAAAGKDPDVLGADLALGDVVATYGAPGEAVTLAAPAPEDTAEVASGTGCAAG